MVPFCIEERKKFIQMIDSKYGNNINDEAKRMYMCANLIDLDFDTPVFRIFSLKRFLSTLYDRKLCLVKPRLWDDPFENFLLNSKGILDDGTEVSFETVREKLYGQCWSLKEECDGLWRNYTNYYSCKKCTEHDFKIRQGKRPISIKVKSTVGKLMNAFYNEKNVFHSLCYFIGKVRYVEMKMIIDYLNKANILDTTNVNQILSLLIKRKSFAYEEEVRLIYSSVEDDCTISYDTYNFDIDPEFVFEEVEFDPWVDNESYQCAEKQIRSCYKGVIKKSKLYDLPFFEVKL